MKFDERFIELLRLSIQDGFSRIKYQRYVQRDGFSTSKYFLEKNDEWSREVLLGGQDMALIYGQRRRCKVSTKKFIEDIGSTEYWNCCNLIVDREGEYYFDYEYRPDLDEEYRQEIIDSIGLDLYDKYQQEDRQRREAAEHSPEDSGAEAEKTPEPSVYSIPELLGFMVEELSQDIPSDWQQLKIVAEVFEEQGKQAVSTVYAHHTGDENWQAFSATNSLGPMNAVLKVQQLMQQDGQTWSRATLIFSSDGSVSIQSD